MNIIITGGSKGIGKAMADAFAEKDNHVFLVARNEADLTQAANEIREKYPRATVSQHAADLSSKTAIDEAVQAIQATFTKVDILINNAGIFKPGSLIDEPDGHLEKQIETNLYSAYHLTRAILPLMLPNQSGHIINMCSIASITAYPNGGSYAISKFALLGFTKCLREELMEKGIKVTAILPGATWSNSWKGVDLPKERLMQASDIADMVLACAHLSPSAVVEEMIVRPQLGDL